MRQPPGRLPRKAVFPDAHRKEAAGRQVAAAGRSTPAHRRDVGYVAQDGALFPHLTVGQNIAYGLSGRRDTKQRIAELLATVALDESVPFGETHEDTAA